MAEQQYRTVQQVSNRLGVDALFDVWTAGSVHMIVGMGLTLRPVLPWWASGEARVVFIVRRAATALTFY